MSLSYTLTETETFTLTHAKHISSKVAADLKRMQRFYGAPSDQKISDFEAEITALLKAGYLNTVSYGYKRNGQWIEPTLKYSASDLMDMYADDDDPGRVRPGADTSGASFYSYLTYSSKWHQLPSYEKEKYDETLPFSRGTADEPSVNGYLTQDKTYSSAGRALSREIVRSY